MTLCTSSDDLFPACKSRKIEARFDGGNITSDAGLLLLRQAEKKLGLLKKASSCLRDPRRKKSCDHTPRDILAQRVMAIASGYEDLNDHDDLRDDLMHQTAAERDCVLAGSSTLCRFENEQDRASAVALHKVILDDFVASFDEAPRELILDFDATNDPVHGRQEGRFFHGYYDEYCFLPLYVFCGDELLVSYLRPSNIDGARHAWAILRLLVNRLRSEWPEVRIIFRGDSGFCRWRMLRWMDRHNVQYLVGLAKNKGVNRKANHLIKMAEQNYAVFGEPQRVFGEVRYGAGTWDRKRRVLVRVIHEARGSNPRYVVTNLTSDPWSLYDDYCQRGEMENRIKEQQLHLFSDRTSAHDWWANQYRLMLSSLAYILMNYVRRQGLKNTVLAQAECQTIRLKLFKIGAVVTRNTRRIRLHLATSFPRQELFWKVARNLAGA